MPGDNVFSFSPSFREEHEHAEDEEDKTRLQVRQPALVQVLGSISTRAMNAARERTSSLLIGGIASVHLFEIPASPTG